MSQTIVNGDSTSWSIPQALADLIGTATRVSKSGNYTATSSDFIIVFTATAVLTLNSSIAVQGTTYRVKLGAAAAGGSVLTLSPNNGKTIEGNPTLVISSIGASVDLVYDGTTNWEAF